MATVEEPTTELWEQKVSVPVVENISWNFKGKVVLVTGGARSQGRAHALSFARAGADIVLADMCKDVSSVPWPLSEQTDLDRTAGDCRAQKVRVLPVLCDVRSSSEVQAMVAAAISEFGKIDILVNNAGIYPFYSIFDLTEEAWDEVIDTDLKGVFLCSKYVAEHMKEQRSGKIITTGSTSSFTSAASHSPYTAAKHGVVGLSKALAIDLAPYGINVNVVCPGGVYTPHVVSFMQQIVAETGQGDEGANVVELGGPWNLFNDEALHPEDISNAIMFMASDAARYITGQTLVVDQGFTIK